MNGAHASRGSRCAMLCVLGMALRAQRRRRPRRHAPRYARSDGAGARGDGHRTRSARAKPSTRQHCTWSGRSAATRSDLIVHAVYSDDSDTVYVYVEHYLMLPPEAPQTTATLRRLMELNWELLVGKFEWNPRTGEVRLSAVLNTDSNFDRRAFRSIVHALDSVAARYYRELHGS